MTARLAPSSTALCAARVAEFGRIANVINLSTPLGLVIARLGRAELRPGPDGSILAEHYRLSFPVAAAFTVGHVLITAHAWDDLLRVNPQLLRHEQRHSWQYVACAGLPFLPLYSLAMAWSWLRSRDLFSRNVFERHAGLADGGYSTS